MRRFLQVLSNMDAQAWRALLVSFVLFGGVGLVFLFGAPLMGFDGETTVTHWLGAASGPWSLPVAVAAFAVLAFAGVPQIMLIAAAVVAFGPLAGSAYSWVGTMVSSLVGFYLGRAAGARTLERFSGPGLKRFIGLVGRNGFLASLVVRLAPSAPFIVVNMAAGVTPMRGAGLHARHGDRHRAEDRADRLRRPFDLPADARRDRQGRPVAGRHRRGVDRHRLAGAVVAARARRLTSGPAADSFLREMRRT